MLNKTIVIFLLMCSTAFAGDYVCHDNGTIISKHRSVDGYYFPACLKITRAEFTSLTRWHKVVGGVVVEMTKAEKDAILLAEATAQTQAENDAVDNFNITVKDLARALVQLGIVDGATLKAKIKEIKGL